MELAKVCFCLILHFLSFNLGIATDDLYSHFYQSDYKVQFERELTSYVNESYVKFTIKSFKYNRTHFATNSTFFFKIDMEYDLEVIVQVYKFLSNEYRPFPIHFEYNFCKGFKYNFSGIKTCAERCGNLECPLKKNIHYYICHCFMDGTKLPPLMPSGRFKLELEGRYKNEIVAKSETYIKIYRPILPDKRFG